MLKHMTRWMIVVLLALPALSLAAAEGEKLAAPAAGATPEHGAGAGMAKAEAEGGERKHEVIEFDAATAVWVLIIFVVLLIILYPTAWKNVLAGLKAREERIRKDIRDAETARERAEATLRDYNTQLAGAENKVREMLGKATADAEKIATTIRMQAQQDAEQIKERTNKDLEAAKKQAMAEFRQYAATVATSAAEQILRRNLNADDQRELVNRSLDQLETVKA